MAEDGFRTDVDFEIVVRQQVKSLEDTKKKAAQTRQCLTELSERIINKMSKFENAVDRALEYAKSVSSVPSIIPTRAETIATIESLNEKIRSAKRKQLISGLWASQDDLMSMLNQTKSHSTFQPVKTNVSIDGEHQDSITILTEAVELSLYTSVNVNDNPQKFRGRIVETENGELNAIRESQIICHVASQAKRMRIDHSHILPFANRNISATDGQTRLSKTTIEGSSTKHHHHCIRALSPLTKLQFNPTEGLPVTPKEMEINRKNSNDWVHLAQELTKELDETNEYQSTYDNHCDPTTIFDPPSMKNHHGDAKGNFDPFRASSPYKKTNLDQIHFKETEQHPNWTHPDRLIITGNFNSVQPSSPSVNVFDLQSKWNEFEECTPQVTPKQKEAHGESDDSWVSEQSLAITKGFSFGVADFCI